MAELAKAGLIDTSLPTCTGKTIAENLEGGVEHFPHTRPALGALVADDHHVPGHDFAVIDGGDRLLLRVEHPGGALVDHHLGGHGGLLDHTAVGGQVALEERRHPGPAPGQMGLP